MQPFHRRATIFECKTLPQSCGAHATACLPCLPATACDYLCRAAIESNPREQPEPHASSPSGFSFPSVDRVAHLTSATSFAGETSELSERSCARLRSEFGLAFVEPANVLQCFRILKPILRAQSRLVLNQSPLCMKCLRYSELRALLRYPVVLSWELEDCDWDPLRERRRVYEGCNSHAPAPRPAALQTRRASASSRLRNLHFLALGVDCAARGGEGRQRGERRGGHPLERRVWHRRTVNGTLARCVLGARERIATARVEFASFWSRLFAFYLPSPGSTSVTHRPSTSRKTARNSCRRRGALLLPARLSSRHA